MTGGQCQTLTLALAVDEHRVSGQLRDEQGEEQRFSSWLGLLSLLQARTRPEDGPDPESRVRLVVAED